MDVHADRRIHHLSNTKAMKHDLHMLWIKIQGTLQLFSIEVYKQTRKE
jgi:hypothetical protein